MSTHFLGSYFCSHSDRLEKRNTVVHCHTINHCYGTPLTFVGRSLHKSCFVLWPVSSPSTVSNSFVFQQNDSFVFQSDWWRPALRISPNSFATLCRQFIGLLRCFAQYRIRVGLKYHRFRLDQTYVYFHGPVWQVGETVLSAEITNTRLAGRSVSLLLFFSKET